MKQFVSVLLLTFFLALRPAYAVNDVADYTGDVWGWFMTQSQKLQAFTRSIGRKIPTENLKQRFVPDLRIPPHDHTKVGWYALACCNNNDCRAFPEDLVTENADGSISLRYTDPYFGPITLVFGKDHVKRRPVDASPDSYWHFCFQVFADSETKTEIIVDMYCVYRPDSST